MLVYNLYRILRIFQSSNQVVVNVACNDFQRLQGSSFDFISYLKRKKKLPAFILPQIEISPKDIYLIMELTTIILFCCTSTYILINSLAVDKITRYQTFRDGDTITSAREEFELGFFSPGSSTNWYLGIWYKKI